jgi:hypothetical protein
LLHIIAKVFYASDLLACPACCVFGEVADVVTELVDALRDVGFGAVPAVFCKVELVD